MTKNRFSILRTLLLNLHAVSESSSSFRNRERAEPVRRSQCRIPSFESSGVPPFRVAVLFEATCSVEFRMKTMNNLAFAGAS